MYQLTINTFKGSDESFISSLKNEGVHVSRRMLFSEQPINSGNKYSVISDIAETMPWNAIAKVIVAWIEAKSNREVSFTLENHGSFMAKGYSVKQVKAMLPKTVSIAVIDTKPDE